MAPPLRFRSLIKKGGINHQKSLSKGITSHLKDIATKPL